MSNLETLMIIFIGVTAGAVVLQVGILAALFVSVKKSSARMEALAQQVGSRLMPTLETTQSILQENRPKLGPLLNNANELCQTGKQQLARIETIAKDVQEMRPKLEKLVSEVTELCQATKQKMERFDTTTQSLLREYQPKVDTMVDTAAEISATVKEQVEHWDATLKEVVDRARLQIIRVDEVVSRTLDKVEDTTEVVQRSVLSPVRQASGVIQGLTAGLTSLFHKGAPRTKQPLGPPKDEWFI